MSNRRNKRHPIKCPDCGKHICDLLIDEKGEIGFAFTKVRVRGDTGELVLPDWTLAYLSAKANRTMKQFKE